MQILAATHSPQHGWRRKGSLQTLCRTGIQVWTKCFCLVAQLCPTLLRPHGLEPARLFCPWDFPGKNTEVSYHFLLQGVFLTQGSNLCLLHWQADSLPLSHWGNSPAKMLGDAKKAQDTTENYLNAIFIKIKVNAKKSVMKTFQNFK